MKLVRMMIQVSLEQKGKLRDLRKQGFTEAGFIRGLLDKEFRPSAPHATAKRKRTG